MRKFYIMGKIFLLFIAFIIWSDVQQAKAQDAKLPQDKIQVVKLEDNFDEILLDFVHIFVIDDKKDGLIIIDTGYPEKIDGVNILLAGLKKAGKDPAKVKHILISHAHPDHFGNAAELQKISGAMIWMSAIDAPVLEDKDVDYPIIYKKDGSLYTGMPPIQKAVVNKKIKDGDVIPLAGGIKVIGTPGHSLGHEVFLWKRYGGILFIGDAVTNINNNMDLPPNYENVQTEKASIKKLFNYKFDKIAFCHGDYIGKNARIFFLKRWRNVN